MKFLHTSDWHLGMTLRGGMSYEADQRHAIGKICETAQNEGVDGILIAGDIFDKSIASQEAIRMCDDIITHICAQMKIPVYMIAGNHDGSERISQYSDLLAGSGLYIAGSLGDKVISVNQGDVDIYLLPWISTDKVKTLFPDEAGDIVSMEDAYRVVLDRYRKQFAKGRKNILVAHAFIVNAQTCVSDRAAEVGKAAAVSSDVFEGFDYVALGHLHGPQDITGNIRYSGSPMAYAFGREEKQVKSVTIIDTDDFSHKIVPIPQLHARCTLKGTYSELIEADHDEEILRGYVRLEVTDSYVGMETIASLREKYPNLLEISGKNPESEDAGITMTIEEFENVSSDPMSIFTQYCRDTMGEEPDEHLRKLFGSAVKRYGKEVCEE